MEFGDRNLELAVTRYAAAAEHGDPAGAAVALGSERGAAGVGIGPSLDDLETVHRIVLQEHPGPPIVRAFADAWAEAALGALLSRGALDHRTGLATTDYLATRLRDLARSGGSRRCRLVVVDCRLPAAPRFAALLTSARVARELLASFPGAETPVGLDPARIAAVVPAGERLDADIARARLAIGRVEGVERAVVRIVAPPADADDVAAFLRGL